MPAVSPKRLEQGHVFHRQAQVSVCVVRAPLFRYVSVLCGDHRSLRVVAGPRLWYGVVYRDDRGNEVLLRVHSCLFCYGDFNLISVSQFQQLPGNAVDFSLFAPSITVSSSGVMPRLVRIPLSLDDGLFALDAEPFQLDDPRYSSMAKCDVTPKGDFVPSHSAPDSPWFQVQLASSKASARILVAADDFGDNLKDFCHGFMAPPAIPPSRRQYDVGSRDDMIQLEMRFFGIGPDRLAHTVAIANGLAAPPSKVAVRDPPIYKSFPQGRMKEGKTPFVSKGRVGNLKHAQIAELVCTDTFETGDTRFRYCLVFYDPVSRWGWIFPMHSKTEIGLAFATFCSQNWVPLILIRDGAGENVGGSLMKELLSRNVKSAFICPHHPQQNFAEGFIGRLTAMASFGMVYSGALFSCGFMRSRQPILSTTSRLAIIAV
jgi:hypothetical protein